MKIITEDIQNEAVKSGIEKAVKAVVESNPTDTGELATDIAIEISQLHGQIAGYRSMLRGIGKTHGQDWDDMIEETEKNAFKEGMSIKIIGVGISSNETDDDSDEDNESNPGGMRVV